MKHRERIAFLETIHTPRAELGIRIDLSLAPELFGHALRVNGLYLWGRMGTEESQRLATLDLDAFFYNETDASKIEVPEGYRLFRLRDLQEFPYHAAIRVHPPDPDE